MRDSDVKYLPETSQTKEICQEHKNRTFPVSDSLRDSSVPALTFSQETLPSDSGSDYLCTLDEWTGSVDDTQDTSSGNSSCYRFSSTEPALPTRDASRSRFPPTPCSVSRSSARLTLFPGVPSVRLTVGRASPALTRLGRLEWEDRDAVAARRGVRPPAPARGREVARRRVANIFGLVPWTACEYEC